MRYMGSKRKVAKEILPIILKDRAPEQLYVEPFVGGCNSFCLVDGPRLGADCHPYLIALWQAVSEGWDPPKDFTKEQYEDVKANKEKYPAHLVGYVGFALSFGGNWFSGWCKDNKNNDYVGMAYRGSMKQFPKLRGVEFQCCDYSALHIPENSIIYCDPPYMGSLQYGSTFNYYDFWDWCGWQASQGQTVFVSEQMAPRWAEQVWEKEMKCKIGANHGYFKKTERLYRVT